MDQETIRAIIREELANQIAFAPAKAIVKSFSISVKSELRFEELKEILDSHLMQDLHSENDCMSIKHSESMPPFLWQEYTTKVKKNCEILLNGEKIFVNELIDYIGHTVRIISSDKEAVIFSKDSKVITNVRI